MRSFMYAAVAALLVTMTMSSQAFARCVCQCSNGHLLPLCSSPLDIPPICPATGCAMVPVTVAPPAVTYQAPAYCRTVRVCDPWGFCRLQQLCG